MERGRHSLNDLKTAEFLSRYPRAGTFSRLRGYREQKPKGENSLIRDVVGGFVATTAALHSGVVNTEAFTPPAITVVFHSPDRPIVNNYSLESRAFPEASPAQASNAPVQTSEAKRTDYLSSVFRVMERYPTKFTKEHFEDLEMYYPIYKTAAEKYGIDPKILWYFHQQETTSSRDPLTNVVRTVRDYDEMGRVTMENTVGYAMQLDQNFYGASYVKEAFNGLEYLLQVKTRYPNDAEQIAGAARKIAEDLKTTKGDFLAAFRMYCAHSIALERYKEFNWRSQVLPSF